MRSFCIILIVLFGIHLAAVPCNAGTEDGTRPGSSDLENWIGHWVTHGDPGSWHAETVCTWSREKDFVICDQLIDDQQKSLLVINYDMQARAYRLVSLGTSREPVIQTATVQDHIWTVHGTFLQDGKTYQIRGKTDFRTPNTYRDMQEHSEDGGAHWIEDSRGRGEKLQH